MDAGTSAAVIAGITIIGKPGAELVKDFVGRIFGPTADAAGTALAHPIVEFNKRRAARAEQLLLRSADVLADAGLEPRPIPDNLLLPLLQNGSLVDDSDLQEIWAQLLASAASGDNKVLPAFPNILAELSGEDAKMLKFIYDGIGDSVRTIMEQYGRSEWEPWQFYLVLENLSRLKLIDMLPQISGRSITGVLGDYNPDHAEIAIEPGRNDKVFLTALGQTFIDACSGPELDAPQNLGE